MNEFRGLKIGGILSTKKKHHQRSSKESA